jgi:hypothetical protein
VVITHVELEQPRAERYQAPSELESPPLIELDSLQRPMSPNQLPDKNGP